MKRNGFTLIELLAIIVILAIIAVITVPIILDVIDNSKRGAAINSAYGYKDSISKYYVTEFSINRSLKLDGEYGVSNGELIGKFEGENSQSRNVLIPLSGNRPTSGKLHYTNNVLDDGCLVIGDYKVTFGSDGLVNETVKGNCDDYVISAYNWNSYYYGNEHYEFVYDDKLGSDLSMNAYVREDTSKNVKEVCVINYEYDNGDIVDTNVLCFEPNLEDIEKKLGHSESNYYQIYGMDIYYHSVLVDDSTSYKTDGKKVFIEIHDGLGNYLWINQDGTILGYIG